MYSSKNGSLVCYLYEYICMNMCILEGYVYVYLIVCKRILMYICMNMCILEGYVYVYLIIHKRILMYICIHLKTDLWYVIYMNIYVWTCVFWKVMYIHVQKMHSYVYIYIYRYFLDLKLQLRIMTKRHMQMSWVSSIYSIHVYI
jgi:hypothetical protein